MRTLRGDAVSERRGTNRRGLLGQGRPSPALGARDPRVRNGQAILGSAIVLRDGAGLKFNTDGSLGLDDATLARLTSLEARLAALEAKK